jgi:Fe-S cluster biogenesis protein NfuA
MNSGEFQKYTQRVDQLVQRVSGLPENEARTAALELLQSVMDLHGAAMSRIVELLSESGDADGKSLSKLGADPLICGLLVLYGVHPLTTEERVARAVEKLRPQLHKKGAEAELLDTSNGSVRVKLESKSHGSNPEKLRAVVQQAIREAAPELAEVIIEGLTSASFVPVNMIQPAMKEDNTYEESAA